MLVTPETRATRATSPTEVKLSCGEVIIRMTGQRKAKEATQTCDAADNKGKGKSKTDGHEQLRFLLVNQKIKPYPTCPKPSYRLQRLTAVQARDTRLLWWDEHGCPAAGPVVGCARFIVSRMCRTINCRDTLTYRRPERQYPYSPTLSHSEDQLRSRRPSPSNFSPLHTYTGSMCAFLL